MIAPPISDKLPCQLQRIASSRIVPCKLGYSCNGLATATEPLLSLRIFIIGFLDTSRYRHISNVNCCFWIRMDLDIDKMQTDIDSHVLRLELHRGLCNCTLPGALNGPCTHCKAELCLTWTILELPSGVKHQPIHLFHLP